MSEQEIAALRAQYVEAIARSTRRVFKSMYTGEVYNRVIIEALKEVADRVPGLLDEIERLKREREVA